MTISNALKRNSATTIWPEKDCNDCFTCNLSNTLSEGVIGLQNLQNKRRKSTGPALHDRNYFSQKIIDKINECTPPPPDKILSMFKNFKF